MRAQGQDREGPGGDTRGGEVLNRLEIAPALMGRSNVVVDLLEQCVVMGDLRADQVFVFDSTGVAFEDVAAAAAVYERARSRRPRPSNLAHLIPFIR